MRLLVVEDERALARHLQQGLRGGGVDGRRLRSRRGRLAAGAAQPLRPRRPRPRPARTQDGSDAAAPPARRRALSTPVLILTARGAVDDRIAGLNAGADDYMGKPFAFGELLARINALHRRGHQRDLVALQRRRPRARRAPPPGAARRPAHRPDGARVQPARVPHAPRRRGGDPLDARRPRLGRALRLALEPHRGVRQPPAQKLEADGAPRLLHTVRGAGYVLRAEPR